MSENKVNFGELRLGDAFELEISNVVNPVTGSVYTSFTGVDLHFSVKQSLDDLDAAAVATLKDGEAGFVDTAGTLTLRLVNNTVSETLNVGEVYFFDGWLKDSNGVWRPFNFGSEADPSYIGYFWVTQAVTRTKLDS